MGKRFGVGRDIIIYRLMTPLGPESRTSLLFGAFWACFSSIESAFTLLRDLAFKPYYEMPSIL